LLYALSIRDFGDCHGKEINTWPEVHQDPFTQVQKNRQKPNVTTYTATGRRLIQWHMCTSDPRSDQFC
jgi:hypothetical protein